MQTNSIDKNITILKTKDINFAFKKDYHSEIYTITRRE